MYVKQLCLCLLFSLSSSFIIGQAELTFDEKDFNFGTILDGEIVQNVFKFTNTGDEPLVISTAKGSCGCTVPDWPKNAIEPGESSYLLVKFNSKNKKGNQVKRVTLTANTDPANTFLTIRGLIEPAENAIETKHPVNVLETENEILKFGNAPVEANLFTLYPNPSAAFINIDIKESAGLPAAFEIYDMMGRIMDRELVEVLESKPYKFNLEHYPSGTYSAIVRVGDKMRLAKQFIVSK